MAKAIITKAIFEKIETTLGISTAQAHEAALLSSRRAAVEDFTARITAILERATESSALPMQVSTMTGVKMTFSIVVVGDTAYAVASRATEVPADELVAAPAPAPATLEEKALAAHTEAQALALAHFELKEELRAYRLAHEADPSIGDPAKVMALQAAIKAGEKPRIKAERAAHKLLTRLSKKVESMPAWAGMIWAK